MVSQPLSQSVSRGFESQRKYWDFSSLKNRAIIALIYIYIYIMSILIVYIHTHIYKYIYIYICMYVCSLICTRIEPHRFGPKSTLNRLANQIYFHLSGKVFVYGLDACGLIRENIPNLFIYVNITSILFGVL